MIIPDQKNLRRIIKEHRANKQTIVLTQGSFDMIHIGHGRYLEKAKSLGDILIVGIDSDAKIKHRKGDDRPVVPEAERLEMLTYLRSVDYVYLKPLSAPQFDLIKLIKPDVLLATQENYDAQTIEQLKKYCTAIEVVEPMATTSTSAKIRLLQIGAAKKMSELITQKLTIAFEEVIAELGKKKASKKSKKHTKKE